MPELAITTGPFAAVYIGDLNSGSVLTQISNIRTGGIRLVESMPKTLLPALNIHVQSDLHKVTMQMTCYTPNDLMQNLAKGLTIAEDSYDPMAANSYVILLLSADQINKQCYLLPSVHTVDTYDVDYDKRRALDITINFENENRDVGETLLYKDNPAELKTLLGSRSPI